jgi:hypothetical protein
MSMETNRQSQREIDVARSAGYEHRDANVSTLLKFGFWLAVILVVVMLGMWGVFSIFGKTQKLGPPASPFESADVRVLPPAPRLQVTPVLDLKNYRDSQREQLETYGWVDKEGGVVRIPIERAMDLVLEHGGLAAEKPVAGAKPLSR